MPKRNYQSEKRRKDLDKQRNREEKRQRKLDRARSRSEPNPHTAPEPAEPLPEPE